MKTKVFFGISARVVLLFSVAMAFTFIPEQLRDFFGDVPHVCREGYCGHSEPDWKWEWGARHYWFYWMGVILFLLSLANLIIAVVNVIRKNYDTTKWGP